MKILFYSTLILAVFSMFFDWFTSPRLKDGVFEGYNVFRNDDGDFQKSKYLIVCSIVLGIGFAANLGMSGLGTVVFVLFAAFRIYIGFHNLSLRKSARLVQIEHLTAIKELSFAPLPLDAVDQYLRTHLKFFFNNKIGYYLAFAWIRVANTDREAALKEVAAKLLVHSSTVPEADWFK